MDNLLKSFNSLRTQAYEELLDKMFGPSPLEPLFRSLNFSFMGTQSGRISGKNPQTQNLLKVGMDINISEERQLLFKHPVYLDHVPSVMDVFTEEYIEKIKKAYESVVPPHLRYGNKQDNHYIIKNPKTVKEQSMNAANDISRGLRDIRDQRARIAELLKSTVSSVTIESGRAGVAVGYNLRDGRSMVNAGPAVPASDYPEGFVLTSKQLDEAQQAATATMLVQLDNELSNLEKKLVKDFEAL